MTAAPQAHPRLLGDLGGVPKVTAYCAYTLTTPVPPIGPPSWLVKESTTRRICAHAVRWGPFPGSKTYLEERAASLVVDDPDVSGPLASAVARYPWAGVTYVTDRPARYRAVSLWSRGQVTYSSYGDDAGWEGHVNLVRQALLAIPEALDLAVLRPALGAGASMMDLSVARPPLPHIDEPAWRNNRHMWSRYVPDAHALQVLTRAHLDLANDLTGWDITDLPGDRYLVQARNLTAWFGQGLPDADTVAAARADFGEMILTPKAIAADPYSWIPGRGRLSEPH